jgi:ankyrin repeat protein
VLSALQDAAGIPASDPAYQRGLTFLLKAQKPDGSWHVKSRLHPPAQVSPPYFETGFPYDHDQFVSAMGTSWAAAALLQALPLSAGERKGPSLDIAPGDQPEWIQVALNGSAAELKKLLDSGMKADARTAEGTTALMFASRDLEKVKLLVERGADVNARAATGMTALMVAARYRGNIDVLRLLLKKGAKPNADKGVEVRNDASAFFFAVMAGDTQMAGALLEAGARTGDRMKIIGRFAQSPLLYSTFLDAAMVEFLISKGANPNEVDDDKVSVLGWAAIGNNTGVAQVLLKRGAQVNHVDNVGMTLVVCCFDRLRRNDGDREVDRRGRRCECEKQGGFDGSGFGEALRSPGDGEPVEQQNEHFAHHEVGARSCKHVRSALFLSLMSKCAWLRATCI